MKITILGNEDNPSVKATISALEGQNGFGSFDIVKNHEDCKGGDFLFALSYPKIIPKYLREGYKYSFVLHGSDLPEGRGWSPVIWQVLDGQLEFTMSLIHMEDPVDSGALVSQQKFNINRDSLFDEIATQIGSAQADLIQASLKLTAEQLGGAPQVGRSSYFGKRNPLDSEIDPYASLSDQWDKIRASDPNRFPAFFKYLGHTYTLKIGKLGDE